MADMLELKAFNSRTDSLLTNYITIVSWRLAAVISVKQVERFWSDQIKFLLSPPNQIPRSQPKETWYTLYVTHLARLVFFFWSPFHCCLRSQQELSIHYSYIFSFLPRNTYTRAFTAEFSLHSTYRQPLRRSRSRRYTIHKVGNGFAGQVIRDCGDCHHHAC